MLRRARFCRYDRQSNGGGIMNQNWKQLSIVQVGGSICLPVLMIGQLLAKHYSPLSAFLAIVIGNLVLFALSFVTATSAANVRKSTAEFAINLFGSKGKLFFVGAMIVSMIGWFAIQLKLMGVCMSEALKYFSLDVGVDSASLLLGCFIAAAGMRGLQGITFIAKAISPLLALTIMYALMQQGNQSGDSTHQFFSAAGISLVVAGSIAAVIDLPTFFREAKSSKDARLAAFFLFCVALPLIEMAGAYLYMHHGGDNLIEILQNISPSSLWKGWILGFLVLAGWTTNNANMYSASVSLGQLFTKIQDKYCILIVCLSAMAIALLPILEHLEVFISFIGILLCNMGAVMVHSFLFQDAIIDENERFINILTVITGSLVGALSFLEVITLSGVPLLEAFLVTFCMKFLFPRKEYAKDLS